MDFIDNTNIVTEDEVKEIETVETTEATEETTEETANEIQPEEIVDQNESQNEEIEEEIADHTLFVTGTITASKLNIRKEANKDADVLTVISKGTSVEVNLTDSTEDFYCVNIVVNSEITTGYAMKKFVSVK